MKKIWIIGPPGVGKTTLSVKINDALGTPMYELDSIYWLENWVGKADGQFRDDVKKIILDPEWIIDGAYWQIEDIMIENSETIIYLESSLSVLLFRVMKRSLKRIVKKEKLWQGNQESFSFVFSRNGLIRYTIKQYFIFKKKFSTYKGYRKVVRIKGKKDMDDFVNYLITLLREEEIKHVRL